MYDIFLVSKTTIDKDQWQNFKKKFFTASKVENVSSFDQIKSKALTRMFWVVWDDISLVESFDLINYTVEPWDEK